MTFTKAVPVLRVSDVAESIAWYGEMLGFVGDPFPATAPHEFAILRCGAVEIMLRRGPRSSLAKTRPYDWDVYLRRDGAGFRELYARCESKKVMSRRMEVMPYGLTEFEVTDPDGYVLCVSQLIDDVRDVPRPSE